MSEPALIPFAAPSSVTEQVFASIYDAVVSLRLPPGAKVSEVEVARSLDVSRQPVRDAFFRLSALGFVSIRPQRATQVTRISEATVQDAVLIRTALEVECLRRVVARAAPAEVGGLRGAVEAQRDALDADAARFHALDEAMHERICALAGHPHVWTVIREQKAHVDRIRFLSLSAGRRREVLAEHAAIVDAVAARDAGLAEARLRAHLRSILDAMPAIRAAHPDYFEAPG